ncbi:MAG TPA: hypothetical protein VFE78_37670 [Gemmataceae bacterium]|jgi:hypothetical protein|nr:hypothetical protein [Gemmataceae bacterium]
MSRRSFYLAIGIFLVLTCGGGAATLLLLRHEPQQYRLAAVPPGAARTERSKEFLNEFCQLISALDDQDPHTAPSWYARFTDEQINSYFDEQFVQSGMSEKLLPEGISQPRLMFEPDRARLAFRYGSGFWSTVISIDLKVWQPKGEANAVALELEGFHAGALPIAAQSLLERISEVGRQNGIEVDWYRHNGHPVALLRFQAEQPRPTLQLQAVQLEQGAITIKGKSGDGPGARTQLQLPDLAKALFGVAAVD